MFFMVLSDDITGDWLSIICLFPNIDARTHGPLTRYVKLRVAHVSGMPGTFSPPPQVRDPDIHHGTCVKHVP